ncbi:hypothetical protein LFT51_02105 [Mycobacterium intracellulare subsp. chimaera]|uniref:Uncharacterized protein n=1 Tax=Mycobacterium timonense TaxID=701043 RepID=A0A7I9ZDW6_9MYCO|nr:MULTISPECIES: hypothetical protein [Mycobacterium avium complex (MAC)]MCA2249059.1 hypothetical protein [Mycobacterium intracellulare]MCA2312658.1 hypothetical protein [Mycobacterium intracellulare subsp. chimaera]MCA2354972.1 hypothetical protein [Mycobacterium intracellulare subsp. chimaera]MDM3935405.1 hypothetical protein [Mycobacterium intracellulare subsp. chimaera]UCN04453.1 hypothetical protein LFT51_02105 [Mycobacterium intracellulare subsp. chimaera]
MTTGADDLPEDGRQVHLLRTLGTDVWPLLKDRSPVAKAEREQALGYDPAAGV